MAMLNAGIVGLAVGTVVRFGLSTSSITSNVHTKDKDNIFQQKHHLLLPRFNLHDALDKLSKSKIVLDTNIDSADDLEEVLKEEAEEVKVVEKEKEISPNIVISDDLQLTEEDIKVAFHVVTDTIGELSKFVDKMGGKEVILQELLVCCRNEPILQAARRKALGTSASKKFDWYDFPKDHKCSLCQDLLAAPTVLSCSHSFCGECITEHVNRCESSSDLEVVVTCPYCRQEIDHNMFYERTLDEIILKSAILKDDCPEKTEYMDRRQRYLDTMNKANKITEEEIETDYVLPMIIALAVSVCVVAIAFNMRKSKV